MGHPLRFYEPNRVYEITVRTIQERFLLRPSEEVNELVLGVIGRAQKVYPSVRLYVVNAMSNHLSLLASSPRPEDLPRFMGFINGNISLEIGRVDVHNWRGKLWGRRMRVIPVMDDESLVGRLVYCLAQGVKENLVERSQDWPGVNCARALTGRGELRGTWFARDEERKAKCRGEEPGPHNYATRYTVKLAKLPCWQELSETEHADRVGDLLAELETKYRAEREAAGITVLGVKRILAIDPHYQPDSAAKSPAPLCHGATKEVREACKKMYTAFVDAFRAAADLVKKGVYDAEFPGGCFPRARPFVPLPV